MLNKEKHQLIMGQILKDIYTDVSIAPLLGLKGGTSAYFFYGLPRFSVDLDFDLFVPSQDNKKIIFGKIKAILEKYGVIKNGYAKRYTIFFFLSYGEDDRNIKIEISTRETPFSLKEQYELKEFLGISVLVAKKGYLFAAKLSALTLRKETATRDIYDIYFFAKNNWDINEEVIKAYIGKGTKEYLTDCVAFIGKIKDNRLLHGLGELIDEKEKRWVKEKLKSEAVFLLKNYMSVVKR